jgi:hypothetical protein
MTVNGQTNGPPAAPAVGYGFDEAPASFNIKAYNPDGFDVMLTLRSDNTGELLDRAGKALEWLKGHGFSPTRPQQRPQPAVDDPTPAQREAELRSLPADNRAPATPDPGEQTFVAEKLAANITSGKTYWKVFGGRFSKFGINIWPEVLNLACADSLINCEDELDPTREYSLTGLTACYVEGADGKGQKVTRLIRSRA